MSISPPPITPPSPITPPGGSMAEDTTFPITDVNLGLLDPVAQSQLLAVSNLGTTTTAKINSTLDLIRTYEDLEVYTLDHTLLNSLADGVATANYTVSNTGSSKFVKVIIILGEFTPTGTPTVKIQDNLNYYEMAVTTTTSKKRIEFNNIPATFVSSFQVENNTGVSFPSSGNSILVVNL